MISNDIPKRKNNPVDHTYQKSLFLFQENIVSYKHIYVKYCKKLSFLGGK